MAFLYIDPTVGNFILQLVIGGIAGLFVTFRLLKTRIVSMFRRGPKNDDPQS